MPISKDELMALNDDEKIGIIQVLEESLMERYQSDFNTEVNVDEDEIQILNERMSDYKKDPSSAISWNKFYKDELERLGNE